MNRIIFLCLVTFLFACSPTAEPVVSNTPTTSQALEPVESSAENAQPTPQQPIAQATDPYPAPTPTSDGDRNADGGYPAPHYTPPPANTEAVNDCGFTETTPSGIPVNLQNLQMSAPSLVLDPDGSTTIWDWMSADKLLLVQPYQQGQHILQTFSISTQNVVTEAVSTSPITPVWYTDGQPIVYNTWIDNTDGSSDEVIMMGGSNHTPEVLVDETLRYSFGSSIGDIYYFDSYESETIQKYSMTSRTSTATSIKPSEWVSADYYHDLRQYGGFDATGYHLYLNATGDKAVVKQFPLMFLYDLSNETVCEIRLGKTSNAINAPLQVKWSPDGRYIAFENAPRNYVDKWGAVSIGMIDLQTNTYYFVQPSPNNYVADFDWSPDSRYIATLGERSDNEMGLFVIEAESGASQEFLSNELLGQGATIRNHAWSPDGTKIAIECPATIETVHDSRICTIDVQGGN